jgi:solute carrier family 35 (UDP-sugar transporter), member A1/2/3
MMQSSSAGGGGGGTASSPGTGNSLSASAGDGSSSGSSGTSSASAALSSFKLLLLVLMVLQNSATVLVGRYTRANIPKSDLYDVNHLILVIECGKFLLSAAFEFHATSGKLMQSLQLHMLDRPADALKILVPALLYLVQNTLLYVALSNLTAPLFQVTYQFKLVTTALVSVAMLQRAYSVQQWICLVILSVGVALAVLGESKADGGRRLAASAEAAAKQNMAVGLVAVSIACLSSALAGVYFEMVLKKAPQDATKQAPASLWMRNIQLSFFSIVIAAAQGLFKSASTGGGDPIAKPYLHGFTFWTWCLVLLQAGGGLLVAAVIKYADNVLKGLATGVSVVVATTFSIVFFGTPLSGQFATGAAMILASVYYFSNPLPPALASALGLAMGGGGNGTKKEEDVVETKNLMPK